eukprot:scaffold8767_cov121-Isochrysis_galbana.AAC.1
MQHASSHTLRGTLVPSAALKAQGCGPLKRQAPGRRVCASAFHEAASLESARPNSRRAMFAMAGRTTTRAPRP